VKKRLESFLRSLNDAQRDAVTAADGPAIVLAGAGSGKTRVLTGRAFYLIAQQEVNANAVLVVTFTNKAAGELQSRLRSYAGDGCEIPWAGTFHSYCARLMRMYGAAIGVSRDFSIYDTDDTDQVLGEILRDQRISRDELSPATLRSWLSFMKNGGTLSGKHPFHRIARELMPVYNERLRMAQALDFDDLLRLPLDLFAARPDILEIVQRKYDHVLIDEFQDTNRHQYEFARMLAAPQNNLYVVGDDDQSIYGWRGAEYRNLFQFQHDLPGTKVFRLEQNYRSTRQILDVANDLIAGNKGREAKRLWTEAAEGEKVTLRQVARTADEAHEVIGEIHHLQRTKGYSWKDFAILFRVNALSRQFEEVLVSQAIPYSIVGGTRFYERKEIKDLLAYLRVLVNRDDEQAWRRILRTPPRGIGTVTLKILEDEARRTDRSIGQVLFTLPDSAGITKSALAKLEPVTEKIAALKEKSRESDLVRCVEQAIEQSELASYYERIDPETSDERIANLAQLVEAARERAQMHPEYELVDFLNEIALVADADEYDEAPERVTLMTMHAAKGLEFPVVFIVGVEEKLIPHQRSMGSVSDLEEERRLLYVGVTRARERLYLTYSQTRYLNGMLEFQEPSRFLHDISQEHLRGWSLPGMRRVETQDDEGEAMILHEHKPRHYARKSNTNPSVAAIMPYQIGDMVQHSEFGLGVVTAKSGDLADLKIRVAFEGVGSKLLAVKFAPIRKVE